MINFLAMILCAMCAIWKGFQGNVGWCLLECGFALVNLPFGLKWIKDYIDD